MNQIVDPEEEWAKLEKHTKPTPKKVEERVVRTPYEKKYDELNDKYGSEFGHSTGTSECEGLLDDLRAFERVFYIMRKEK